MSAKKVGFEDMPVLMASLVEQVKTLNVKVDAISASSPEHAGTSSGRVILGTNDVCKILRKTRGTIYRMVGKGELPGYKSGKTLSFFEDEIMDWLMKSKRLTAEEMMQMIDRRDPTMTRVL